MCRNDRVGPEGTAVTLHETVSYPALPRAYTRLQDAIEAASLGDWEWDVVRGEVFWPPRLHATFGVGRKNPSARAPP